jgi:NAD+ diphosphatase
MLCQSWPKALERPAEMTLVGYLEDRPCLLAELPAGKGAGQSGRTAGHAFRDLRSLHGLLCDGEYQAAGAALAVLHFLRTSRFCPRCGKEAERDNTRWLRRCPACAHEQEPRTHPTVIALLHDGLQVLLTQPVGLDKELFTLPATPVGPGQGLEQALCEFVRETLEIKVPELLYFGSQPWPLPDRVVIGFQGAVEAQRPVRFNKDHFQAARWFHIDDLPAMPPPLSMARRLADWYAQLPRIQGRPSIPKH